MVTNHYLLTAEFWVLSPLLLTIYFTTVTLVFATDEPFSLNQATCS